MFGGLLRKKRRPVPISEEADTQLLLCYPVGRSVKLMVCPVADWQYWKDFGWVRILTDPGERDRDREIFEAYWEEVNRTR